MTKQRLSRRAVYAGTIIGVLAIAAGWTAASVVFSFTQSPSQSLPAATFTEGCSTLSIDDTYSSILIGTTTTSGYAIFDCSGSAAFSVTPGGTYSDSVASVTTGISSIYVVPVGSLGVTLPSGCSGWAGAVQVPISSGSVTLVAGSFVYCSDFSAIPNGNTLTFSVTFT